MAERIQKVVETKRLIRELRTELLQSLVTATNGPGDHATAVPCLTLHNQASPTPKHRTAHVPRLTIFVQGQQRISIGNKKYVCDEETFFLSSIEAPVQAEIIVASPQTPFLALTISLDLHIVREILSRDDLNFEYLPMKGHGMTVGKTSVGILNAALKTMDLLAKPDEIPFFTPLLQKEFIYRILQTPQGARLRAVATVGEPSQRTTRAIACLRANFKRAVRVQELAAAAQMAVSTLNKQFSELTGMSPLQYQKELRLESARQHMLKDKMSVTDAAFQVGYRSVNNFSREYARHFGQPPVRDITVLRKTTEHNHAPSGQL